MAHEVKDDGPLQSLLEGNRRYAAEAHNPSMPAPPRLRLAVVTCMDARIVPLSALGLRIGDAHVLRNAGGRVTGDVLRSLAVSCGIYETRDIAVVHHTDCGMLNPPGDLAAAISARTARPVEPQSLCAIGEPDEDLSADVDAIRESPLIPDDLRIWGLRYDVSAGLLRLLVPAGR